MSDRAVALWERQQAANLANYEGFPLHSCSVAGHEGAKRFRRFVAGCADPRGPVLDVGCGPQRLPSYLGGWPLHLVHGIDPLPPADGPHPFRFVQGKAEVLPWPDGYFATVLAATSLDHVVDPARVLKEVRRVLRRGGRFLVWCTLWPDAAPYDAADPPAELTGDGCHAFHLGQWFLDLAAEDFTLERRWAAPPDDYLEFAPK